MLMFSAFGPRNGHESSVPVKILTFGPKERLFRFLGAPRDGVPVRSGLLTPLLLLGRSN